MTLHRDPPGQLIRHRQKSEKTSPPEAEQHPCSVRQAELSSEKPFHHCFTPHRTAKQDKSKQTVENSWLQLDKNRGVKKPGGQCQHQ